MDSATCFSQMSTSGFVAFEGAGALRQRLVMSLLSGRPVKISHIRSTEDDPGLKGTTRKRCTGPSTKPHPQ